MTDTNVTKASEETEEHQPQDDSPGENGPLDDTSHLEEVPDGSGCTEIWEHLSERREKDGEDT